MKNFLALVILACACMAQTYPNTLHQTNQQLTVIQVQYPMALGGLVGTGTTLTPVGYKDTIVRCTDVNTDPTNTKYFSYEVGDNGGGNEYIWNSNHTMLRVIEAATGQTVILAVSPKCSMVPGSKTPVGATWSHTDPNVDFIKNGTTVSQRKFNWKSPTTPPTTSVLFDFKSCPALSTIKPTWDAQLSSTYDDNVFLSAFGDLGGQDTGQYVVAYFLNTGQCQIWNTLAGAINGALGGVSSGNPKTSYPFTIHDATLYPGGYAVVSIGKTCTGCPSPHGPFVWKVGTTVANLITKSTGGHLTNGFNTYANLTAAPKMAARSDDDLLNITYISSNENVNFPSPQDTHMGWQNVDPLDSYPIFGSQVSTGKTQPIRIDTPLENEVWAIDLAREGYFRFAPCLTSGIANSWNFRSQYCIAGVSGDGAAIAFGSDGEGSLGNTDGKTATCTLGINCRSDVFLVFPKLK